MVCLKQECTYKQRKEKMIELDFEKQPTFAELWDACLRNLLYDQEEYTKEVCELLHVQGIDKTKKILDTAAGTGFIGLHLRMAGYDVTCCDPGKDERAKFKSNANILGVSDSILPHSWKKLEELKQKYDFLFCRGNSFIYANGGWNSKKVTSTDSDLQAYERTLQTFYDKLNSGGFLYIDKFNDGEPDHNEIVCKLKVGNHEEGLSFFSKIHHKKNIREASMIRTRDGEIVSKVPNQTYNLSCGELEKLLSKVGFAFERATLETEKNFTVWLARKSGNI